MSIIFENSISHNRFSLLTKEEALVKLNDFNCMKRIIKNCCNDKKKVDIKLLYILLKEMNYKIKIYTRNILKEQQSGLFTKATIDFRKIDGQSGSNVGYGNTDIMRMTRQVLNEFSLINPMRTKRALLDDQEES